MINRLREKGCGIDYSKSLKKYIIKNRHGNYFTVYLYFFAIDFFILSI